MNNWIAAITLLLTVFIQSCAGIWWASRLQTTQEAHSRTLAKMESQREGYPVLENRINNLETSMNRIFEKMDDFLDELRGIKHE